MVNFKKSALISSVTALSCFISTNAYSFDQFITVKFKQNPSKEYIQELSKMTNTKVEKNLGNNTYRLKVQGIANKSKIDQYSEMFLIMKNIQSVSPLPKEKIADQINPYYYMNISPNNPNANQNNQNSNGQNSTTTNNTQINSDGTNTTVAQSNNQTITTTQGSTQPQTNNQVQTPASPEPQILMQPIPDELIVKFNKAAPAEDVQLLNQGLGGGSNITYLKDTDSYKVKLPESVSQEYAMDFYQNNPLVESVKQNEIKVDPAKAEQKKQDGLNVQSGVALAVPLSGKDVKVTFKIGKSEEGYKWFENAFGAQMVTKKGFHTYVMRFPGNINPKFAARAVKACPIVQSSEVVSE